MSANANITDSTSSVDRLTIILNLSKLNISDCRPSKKGCGNFCLNTVINPKTSSYIGICPCSTIGVTIYFICDIAKSNGAARSPKTNYILSTGVWAIVAPFRTKSVELWEN